MILLILDRTIESKQISTLSIVSLSLYCFFAFLARSKRLFLGAINSRLCERLNYLYLDAHLPIINALARGLMDTHFYGQETWSALRATCTLYQRFTWRTLNCDYPCILLTKTWNSYERCVIYRRKTALSQQNASLTPMRVISKIIGHRPSHAI